MSEGRQVNDQVTYGAQVSDASVKRLAAEGFKTVVNLREAGEKDQPLSPDEERGVVEGAGLKYLHIPVSGKEMKAESMDLFRREVQALPGPAFVHCNRGTRAGIFAMIAAGVDAGWSAEQALRKIEQMGIKPGPEMSQFVTSYLESHRKRQ